jgi:hypothetical protein
MGIKPGRSLLSRMVCVSIKLEARDIWIRIVF